jgi:hypothetical protein
MNYWRLGDSHGSALETASSRGVRMFVLTVSAWTACVGSAGAVPTFTKVTEGEIVTESRRSFSCNWFDYDGDSDLDLFVTHLGTPSSLFRNDRQDGFTKVLNALTTPVGESFSAAVGDYDNDGLPDVYVVNFNQQRFLYRNEGAGEFTRVLAPPLTSNVSNAYGCSWVDVDEDGLLDMYVVNGNGQNNHLYRNLGGGVFDRDSASAIANDAAGAHGTSWSDYDNDGDLDLFVATNDGGVNHLYRNDGTSGFSRVNALPFSTDAGTSIGASWGDIDNDGNQDLLVTNSLNENDFLYRNLGDGTFAPIADAEPTVDGRSSTGSCFGDMDNDGDLDLIVANSSNQTNFLYENDGTGDLALVAAGDVTTDARTSRGVVWVDVDQDGDLDLFVANGFGSDDRDDLYLNDGNGNHWLEVICVGTLSNRSAIGARVRVKARIDGIDRWQVREVVQQTGGYTHAPSILHFGLGNALDADSILITWPSGTEDVLSNVESNRLIRVTEGETNPAHTPLPTVVSPKGPLELLGNRPNPFHGSTRLLLRSSEARAVRLTVHDASGTLVRVVHEGPIAAGITEIRWDGRNATGHRVPSGTYFCALHSGAEKSIRRALVVR